MFGAGHNSFHGHKNKDNLNVFKKICEDDTFCKVSTGFTHALAINKVGQIYSWG
jgi:alpha-tubulin suppressor-like RCC1 family protein